METWIQLRVWSASANWVSGQTRDPVEEFGGVVIEVPVQEAYDTLAECQVATV